MKIKQFFTERNDRYSMNRLLSFVGMALLAFDALWTTIAMNQTWDITINELILAAIVIGGKVAQKFIETKTNV